MRDTQFIDDHGRPMSAGNPWLLAVAIAAAAAGQLLIIRELGSPWMPPALWLFAAALSVCVWKKPLTLASRATVPAPTARWRVVAASVPLLLAAWAGAAENTFRWWGVAAWLGSVGLWLWGWGAFAGRLRDPEPWRRWQAATFVLILLGAGLFRFWDIAGVPLGMTSDHVEKLLDVHDILDGKRPIFLERNTGREPLQFYLTAALAGPLGLGVSHTTLKVGTALVSLVTVVLIYLLARWGAGLPRSAALLAMAMLATSKWHVEISRVGLRFPYAAFGVALTLIFFLRALRHHHRRDWLLSGAALAVALFGYTPVRILPVLLAAGVLLWILFEQGRRRTGLSWPQALTNVALLPLTTLIAFLPLLRYSVDEPEDFWFRTTSRLLPEDGPPVDVLARLAENSWNALRMFHYVGDRVWVNTLPLDPVLDRITGALLIIGIAMVVAGIARRWSAAELTLLLALPVLLLPSILSLAFPRENPSVVRAGGALPVVMLMAALPLWGMASAGTSDHARRSRTRRWALGTAIALVMVTVAQRNASVYFGPYAEQYAGRADSSHKIAEVVLRHAPAIGGIDHAYLLLWPHWVDTRAVGIHMGAPRWNNVLENPQSVRDVPHRPARLVVLPVAAEAELLDLHTLWPDARTELVAHPDPSKSFYVVVR